MSDIRLLYVVYSYPGGDGYILFRKTKAPQTNKEIQKMVQVIKDSEEIVGTVILTNWFYLDSKETKEEY